MVYARPAGFRDMVSYVNVALVPTRGIAHHAIDDNSEIGFNRQIEGLHPLCQTLAAFTDDPIDLLGLDSDLVLLNVIVRFVFREEPRTEWIEVNLTSGVVRLAWCRCYPRCV